MVGCLISNSSLPHAKVSLIKYTIPAVLMALVYYNSYFALYRNSVQSKSLYIFFMCINKNNTSSFELPERLHHAAEVSFSKAGRPASGWRRVMNNFRVSITMSCNDREMCKHLEEPQGQRNSHIIIRKQCTHVFMTTFTPVLTL